MRKRRRYCDVVFFIDGTIEKEAKSPETGASDMFITICHFISILAGQPEEDEGQCFVYALHSSRVEVIIPAYL